MQIVFVNRLERSTGQGEPERRQVFIGEDEGAWTAGWRLTEAVGSSPEQTWYEGVSWEELLAAFRHGVAGMMREGFRPMLDSMLEEIPVWERSPRHHHVLQCYADGCEAAEPLEKLRAWRRTQAAAEGRSAYLIATNRELQLLAVFLPQTTEELQQIPGFGPVKTEKYGAELTAMLSGYPRAHAFPLDWVSGQVDARQQTDWLLRRKQDKYGKLLETIREKRELLEAIRSGRTLQELAAELKCARRQLMERIEKLDEEGYDVLPIVERELAEMPPEELTQVESAIRELGDRYLKPILQRVYGGGAGTAAETERKYERLRMARIRMRRTERAG